MDEAEIVRRIKGKKWDVRVQRQGHLQPKAVLCDAEVRPITITTGITITCANSIWVDDCKLYDDEVAEEMWSKFELAFKHNRRWSAPWVSRFDSIALEVFSLERELAGDWHGERPLQLKANFDKYQETLMRIQKYYTVAVPLANYCEASLSLKEPALLEFAFPFKRLDINRMEESLVKIKRASEEGSGRLDKLVAEHLRNYSWIKNSYGIRGEYTRSEVLSEIRGQLPLLNVPEIPKSEYSYLLTGLQIGIYLRSRIKELSQRVWHAADPLLDGIADFLRLDRDQFLALLPEEVLQSMDMGACLVGTPELKRRQEGFVVGILDGKRILLTGKAAPDLFRHFNKQESGGEGEITGTCASIGIVRGNVRIIRGQEDFGKLKQGEILVTAMTTPDFVVIMRRAGAIVTDEGGLSCHAAIVSRELKVPCIVGTKNATRTLKDGDRVEVDATNGIVRKLD
ncbi:MAG TPA: PEP-utilizing enzyme [Candidatus Norongarragalinales archaeon]|nr:PEP-utilizing enzyme [Candidatus Norongarragalinales archaeon]